MQHALRHLAACLAVAGLLGHANIAAASDIGVTPTAVHLDKSNDRATVSVINSAFNVPSRYFA